MEKYRFLWKNTDFWLSEYSFLSFEVGIPVLMTISKSWTLFEKWFGYFEANCLRKFRNGTEIVVGPAFFELLIETCKILFV